MGRGNNRLQNVQRSTKRTQKQIITVIEPIYIEILNDDLVGFASTASRDMLDRLFLSYGSITAVDIEHNF
jgi:hypothetical protein